jgi:ribosomal protein L40E
VAEVEPEPPAPSRIAPITETILHFPTRPAPVPDQSEGPPAVAAEDDSPELAARRAQLDVLGLDDPGQGPVRPERSGGLPYRSRGAPVRPEELAVLAAGRASFWEASAREVASAGAHVGVQSCGECGLSLSANARFCRRCGTRQARSA